MHNRVREAVERAYHAGGEKGLWPQEAVPSYQVSPPRQEAHGDFAANLALVLAAQAKRPPCELAAALAALLQKEALFERVEVAGPGFVNLFIAPNWWQENLRTICLAGEAYGRQEIGAGRKVLVEFVSANPTGPLHVGHGRGAAVGDSLARVLEAAGFEVDKEYYVNDVGNQMRTLGASVYLRYCEYFGREIEFPEEYYQGNYIKEIAVVIAEREGARYLDSPLASLLPFFTDRAVETISSGIRQDLEDFGVSFDKWLSERSLHDSGFVEQTIEELRDNKYIYEQDGALWFRSTAFGDEKDRVVRRANGLLTYFASDIAYHCHKIERGYDFVVDVWGADHHGYVPRVKAAVQALGYPADKLRVLLVQLVNLMEHGKLKAMSTRAGEFITLREVLDDVGRDAARFIFLTRRCDSHLDFDLDLARSQSQDNPVYYVQYAHARLCSVFRNASEQGVSLSPPEDVDVLSLSAPEEIALLKHLDAFPQVIADCAVALEPHHMSFYLSTLAGLLHTYYARHRFLNEDPVLTQARLLLAQAIRTVFRQGLYLLGVSAPEKM